MNRTSRRLVGALLLALCGGALARAGAEPVAPRPESDPEVLLEPVFGLTSFLRSAQVLHERAGVPFRVDTLRPSEPGRPPAAAFVMPPPCKVLLTRPDTEIETTLRLAVGIDESEFAQGRASVRFIADLDGERVLDEVRPARLPAGPAERAWISIDLPAHRGRQLVLTTQPVGAGHAPTKVGFVRVEELERRELTRRPAEPAYPNVLFVCVGGLRPDRLTCHGYVRPTSPTIDSLAGRGTRFERAFSGSSSALLSTASLMTGLPAPQHAALDPNDGFLGRELATLAESFQAAGVATAAFSTHPVVTAARGFDQGFDSFEEASGLPARELIPEALEWLDAHADRRFFLSLHLGDLRPPFGFDPESVERLGLAPLADFPTELAKASADDERALTNRYDAAVATVDLALGRLLDGLKERGLTETTIVCLTSDHGQELLEHGWVGGGAQLFDESVRVPLVLAGPGVPAGDVLPERVESRFVVETLRRLARVGTGARGADLLQRYARIQEARAPFFFALRDGRWVEPGQSSTALELYAVDVDGFRLFWSPDPAGAGRVRLHDLSADPAMQVDVAGASPQRTYAFRRMIESWLDLGDEVRPAGLGGRADGRAIPRVPPRGRIDPAEHERGSGGE